MADELSLVVRGRRLYGWNSIMVTLTCDAFPGEFSVGMTARDQASANRVVAAAGDECQVFIGQDQVLQGYIDLDSNGGDARSHSLALTGRGKTQDLVDCCAEISSQQVMNGDVFSIAKLIATPYGIEVALINDAAAGPKAPQWAVDFTEKGADIIQRLAKNAGLMVYEDATGRLVLANVGSAKAAGGIVYGRNVERWNVDHSMHDRFSEIKCANLPVDTLGDLEGQNFFATEKDPNVTRHRQMVMVLEEVAENPQEFTKRKAKWEIARRAGRGTIVTATVDSWRDSDGALWTPNTIIPVSLPDGRLEGREFCLAEVKFRKDETGTHADLVAMPKEAFTIEPVNLLPTATAELTGPGQATTQ